jgi:hypothetical protein
MAIACMHDGGARLTHPALFCSALRARMQVC